MTLEEQQSPQERERSAPEAPQGATPRGPLARVLRLARAGGAVLRRHGPLTLTRYTLMWLGGKRGYFLRDLLMETPDFSALPDASPEKLALCISGVGSDPMRYRCAHLAEQLAIQGYQADVVEAKQAQLTESITQYSLFVLHRVMADPIFEAFVAEARKRGKIVLFDTDDLVFDVSAFSHLPAIQEFSDIERKYTADTIERTGRMLRACDAVTASTNYLCDYIVKTAVAPQQVICIPNVVSAEMVAGADAALGASPHAVLPGLAEGASGTSDAPLTVGYFSGTRTHNRDFLEAADALLWALERYPLVRLQIVGPLTLDSRFDQYSERIKRLPLQLWQSLPQLYTTLDINLAPLERNSPFTEAKSCIKYLEAALCNIPTVASPRSDFQRVISHGVTGLLADTPDEWRAALERLIESPEERCAMGERANADVRRNYTTMAQATATCDLLRTLAPSAFAAVTHDL